MSFLNDQKHRYVRIPTPLKRESNAYSYKQLNLIKLHKRSIDWFRRQTGITDYGLYWLSFIAGVLITFILERLFLH